MEVLLVLVVGIVVGWSAGDAVPALTRFVRQRRQTDPQPIHTMTRAAGWKVRRGDDAIAHFATKAEAQRAGRYQAKQDAVEHVIHRLDDSVGVRHDHSDPDPADRAGTSAES